MMKNISDKIKSDLEHDTDQILNKFLKMNSKLSFNEVFKVFQACNYVWSNVGWVTYVVLYGEQNTKYFRNNLEKILQ